MLKVGSEGSVGDVEMQDLIFTTKSPTVGAVLVKWNIKADGPGSAGLWGSSAFSTRRSLSWSNSGRVP